MDSLGSGMVDVCLERADGCWLGGGGGGCGR